MAFKMNKPSITQGTTSYKSALKHAAHYPGNKADHTLASHGKKLAGDVAAIGAGVGQVAKTLSKSRQGDRSGRIYSFGDNYTKGKSMYETGETSKEYDDKKKQNRIDSATKKKGSVMKTKSWDEDSSSTRKERRSDEKIGGRKYNQNKAERLQKRSKKANDKYVEAGAKENEGLKKHGAAYFTGEGLSKDEAKANRKSSKKFGKTSQKAAVKEALAKRELAQKGHNKKNKPGVVMRDGKGLEVKMPGWSRDPHKRTLIRKGKQNRAGNLAKNRISLEGGSVKVVDKKRVAQHQTIAGRKEYRQDKGLRGNLNTRRDAKGKEKI